MSEQDRSSEDAFVTAEHDGLNLRHPPEAKHWLLFSLHRVVGCACGFRSDLDQNDGFGDDVVDHLLEAGAADQRTRARATVVRPLRRIYVDSWDAWAYDADEIDGALQALAECRGQKGADM